MKHGHDICPACDQSYYAERDYSERAELPCQCGETSFCQACVADLVRCARPGCKAVFCSDECASGTNLDGDSYCAAHVPLPKAEDPIERFTVALERFVSAAEAVRVCVNESAAGF